MWVLRECWRLLTRTRCKRRWFWRWSIAPFIPRRQHQSIFCVSFNLIVFRVQKGGRFISRNCLLFPSLQRFFWIISEVKRVVLKLNTKPYAARVMQIFVARWYLIRNGRRLYSKHRPQNYEAWGTNLHKLTLNSLKSNLHSQCRNYWNAKAVLWHINQVLFKSYIMIQAKYGK